jgi:hypothetical protein
MAGHIGYAKTAVGPLTAFRCGSDDSVEGGQGCRQCDERQTRVDQASRRSAAGHPAAFLVEFKMAREKEFSIDANRNVYHELRNTEPSDYKAPGSSATSRFPSAFLCS